MRASAAVVRYQQERSKELARAKKLDQPEPLWLSAVHAADSKQAKDVRVLDLREITSLADFFVICSGSNARQVQAIAEEIGQRLKQLGERPSSIEGFDNAEWVLMDYGDCVIHVFSPSARTYYDLERLWRDAKLVHW
ncbi:MAG TPA: ribosome silencing factor [Bryobacteraceae bacterium]|nr:ribosome silencing factor [Bryobacteraceae bacterium]